jgi:tripartite ATP-independent transporter DctM subunit
MADVLGRSVGDMYKGALIPGLMLTGLYALYVFANTLVRPEALPPLPPEARTLRGQALLLRVLIALLPPLALIFLVLGTIFIGWATPTEGGAMGAVGALLLAASKGRLTRPVLVQAMASTAKITSFVIFILIGSSVFSLTFRGVDGDLWVEHLLTSLPGGALGFLIFVNLMVFLLAFFLDFFEIAFIILPLLAPVAEKLGIDLVWFGVLIGVNLQTSFMHPPFGFALFYLRSVAPPEVRTSQIYWGAVPFLGIQLLMVILIVSFPQLVSWGLDGPSTMETPTEVVIPQQEGSSLLDSLEFDGLLAPPPLPATTPPASQGTP